MRFPFNYLTVLFVFLCYYYVIMILDSPLLFLLVLCDASIKDKNYVYTNHDLAPELAAYTLTRSFSYASHQCGRHSLTPNCHIYTVAGATATVYIWQFGVREWRPHWWLA